MYRSIPKLQHTNWLSLFRPRIDFHAEKNVAPCQNGFL